MTRSLVLAALTALALAAPASAQQPFEPSPIQHVEVNGANLGYRTVGTGPPLVMIMGISGTMAEWDPALIADLATQHKIVLFDNRGITMSLPSPVRGLTIAKMARPRPERRGRCGSAAAAAPTASSPASGRARS